MKFCLFEEKATPERIWLSLDDDMLVTGLSLSLQCKVYQIQKKTFSKVCKNTEISSTENYLTMRRLHSSGFNYLIIILQISAIGFHWCNERLKNKWFLDFLPGILILGYGQSDTPLAVGLLVRRHSFWIRHFCLLVYAVVLSFIYECVSLSLTLWTLLKPHHFAPNILQHDADPRNSCVYFILVQYPLINVNAPGSIPLPQPREVVSPEMTSP